MKKIKLKNKFNFINEAIYKVTHKNNNDDSILLLLFKNDTSKYNNMSKLQSIKYNLLEKKLLKCNRYFNWFNVY